MVKFEHTVFALPFALSGMLLAANGLPKASIIGWIVIAMVAARSAAMAFNRIVDRAIDAKNPRTAQRAIPARRISLWQATLFLALMVTLFVLAAYMLNPLALVLSPVALVLILTYSFAKRFTWLCHLWLGVSIGIAPTAAWIAVTGSLSTPPLWLTGAVSFWIAGFDILYSLADEEFDKSQGLSAMPARFGAARALSVSRGFHAITVFMLIGAGVAAGLGVVYFAGVAVIALALAYEQSLVRVDDLSKLNVAFFTMNGLVSISLFLFVLADWLVRR